MPHTSAFAAQNKLGATKTSNTHPNSRAQTSSQGSLKHTKASQPPTPTPEDLKTTAALQIFGDLYIPYRAIKATGTTGTNPRIFSQVKRLLDSSAENMVNFEGVATSAKFPYEIKTFLLKMPLWVTRTLRQSGIRYASLANNHSMDYGTFGLFSTTRLLQLEGITPFGAGLTRRAATAPVFLPLSLGAGKSKRLGCFIALSRTLPQRFWAGKTRPGTGFLSYKATAKAIKKCKSHGAFTATLFHWGQERTTTPKPYQIELAHLSIDAGADLVIGHHPHIIQEIEIYKNKPIFYSIGNFAFGSYTLTTPQEGMSVRIAFDRKSGNPIYNLVPINVHNKTVKFRPRLYKENTENPLERYIPTRYCKRRYSTNFNGTYYSCKFH